MSPGRSSRTVPGRARAVWPLLVALVACLVHARSVGNGFALDDLPLVRDNPKIVGLERLPAVFVESYWPRDGGAYGLYRPVTSASFVLNRALFGPGPFGFHAVNVLLHALVAALVWVQVRDLRTPYGAPLLSALLFAVHPLHSEAVANVVGRAELLGAAGVLTAWICHRRAASAPRQRAWSVAAPLAYLLALLSKENSVMAPALFMLDDLLRRRSSGSAAGPAPRWTLYGGYAACFGVAMALRSVALGGLHGTRNVLFIENPLYFAEPVVRIATALWVQVRYAGLFVWPASLGADYGHAVVRVVDSVADPRLWAGLVWTAALAAALVAGWRRSRVLALGVTVWVLFLLPSSNLPFPVGTIMGERLAYLPSVGACLLAGVAGAAMTRRRDGGRASTGRTVGVVAVSAALLAALAGRTLAREPVWKDNLTLARNDVRHRPASAKLQAGLGIELHARGDLDGAEAAYRAAVEIFPDYAQIRYNLGRLLLERGAHEEAITHLLHAREVAPLNPSVYAALAPALEAAGRHAEALDAYARGCELNSGDFDLRLRYGGLLLASRRTEEAREQLTALARDDGVGGAGGLAAGLVLELDGRIADARAVYRQLLAVPQLATRHRRRAEDRLRRLDASAQDPR